MSKENMKHEKNNQCNITEQHFFQNFPESQKKFNLHKENHLGATTQELSIVEIQPKIVPFQNLHTVKEMIQKSI